MGRSGGRPARSSGDSRRTWRWTVRAAPPACGWRRRRVPFSRAIPVPPTTACRRASGPVRAARRRSRPDGWVTPRASRWRETASTANPLAMAQKFSASFARLARPAHRHIDLYTFPAAGLAGTRATSSGGGRGLARAGGAEAPQVHQRPGARVVGTAAVARHLQRAARSTAKQSWGSVTQVIGGSAVEAAQVRRSRPSCSSAAIDAGEHSSIPASILAATPASSGSAFTRQHRRHRPRGAHGARRPTAACSRRAAGAGGGARQARCGIRTRCIGSHLLAAALPRSRRRPRGGPWPA